MLSALSDKYRYLSIIIGISILLGLYFTSRYSYLLFHSLSEVFSIFVAGGIFMVAWNSRKFLDNNYLLIVGIAYLFVGGLDLIHTLAYKGMGVFTGYNANLPTQLWIAARYLESLSLLMALFFLNRRINANILLFGYAGVTALLLPSIFAGAFPDCFIEGVGLTDFKKVSEYLISLILTVSIGVLYQKRDEFDESVYWLIIVSIFLTIGSELAFTFYISVYDFSNLIGHYLKLFSFYLIYRAIIHTGFVKPYDLLFRNLKKSEANLRQERDNLQKALAEIKILRGILPICSHCKKIRDERGYWNKIEQYIQKYSDAEFSHGICPDCARKLYPNLNIYE